MQSFGTLRQILPTVKYCIYCPYIYSMSVLSQTLEILWRQKSKSPENICSHNCSSVYYLHKMHSICSNVQATKTRLLSCSPFHLPVACLLVYTLYTLMYQLVIENSKLLYKIPLQFHKGFLDILNGKTGVLAFFILGLL